MNNWIAPQLGGIRVRDLTPARVAKFQADRLVGRLCRAGEKPGPLSTFRGELHLVAFGPILAHAVKLQIITSNPATLVPKPKVPRPTVTVLTPDQVGKLLGAVAGHRLAAIYHLAFDRGLRLRELFSLRWDDFDPAAGTLRVTKAMSELNGRIKIKELKTANGRRLVKLDAASSGGRTSTAAPTSGR